VTLPAKLLFVCAVLSTGFSATESVGPPEILRISPTSGPEGTRVVITGRNLQTVTGVFLGDADCDFKAMSEEELVALVPHKAASSAITVLTPGGRASSPFAFAVLNDPRIPEEVSYKSGYINPVPAPGFGSVLLWGIAIADTRVPGYQDATVEVAWTQLSCQADGKNVILNHDAGDARGGLYRRIPWFGTDQHELMPLVHQDAGQTVMLKVGQRADRVWHFWSASPRPALPPGKLEGCEASARVKISPGALLQLGMDYWRNPTVPYGSGGNNHEAGVSNWYFSSDRWQEAVFTDIGGPQF